jgi:hypothetical protein
VTTRIDLGEMLGDIESMIGGPVASLRVKYADSDRSWEMIEVCVLLIRLYRHGRASSG